MISYANRLDITNNIEMLHIIQMLHIICNEIGSTYVLQWQQYYFFLIAQYLIKLFEMYIIGLSLSNGPIYPENEFRLQVQLN